MKNSLWVTLGLSMAAVVVPAAAYAQALVKVDGSSTVYPITEAVAEEFQSAKRGAIRVTVGISGTGGGFKKFCRGEIDIADASRPIKSSEMEDCKKAGIKYIELPIAFDALTVVVNPKNPLNSINVADLRKMWQPEAQGKVGNWNEVNASFPSQALKLYGPGTDSGTFEYFTEAVVGKAKSSRGDYTASEDDNVLVQGVSRDVGGIGYFGYAYYYENKDKLKALSISPAEGKSAVAPSEDSVVNGSYQPLSRPIFIYVSVKAAEKPEVKEFVEFYLNNAAKLSKEVKYIPLTSADYQHAAANFKNRKSGTAFGGHSEVGVKIADLLKRDPKE